MNTNQKNMPHDNALHNNVLCKHYLTIEMIIVVITFFFFVYFTRLLLKYAGNESLVYTTNFILFISTIVVAHIIIHKRSYYIYITSFIIVILWIGYIFKLYYLLYQLESKSTLVSDYISNMYKLEIPLIYNPQIIDQYNEILIVTFLTSTFFIICLTFFLKNPNARRKDLKFDNSNINQKKVTYSLRLTLMLFVFISVVVLKTRIGITSENIDYVIKLPFRLGGIIQSILNFFLPSLFMLMTYYAFQSRSKILIRKTLLAYITFCILTTLITTSKSYVFIGFFSLFLFTVYFYGLTKKVIVNTLIGIIILSLINDVASVFRIVRGIEPAIDIFSIPFRALEYWNYSDISTDNRIQFSNIGFLLRVSGADSLLDVINWNFNRPNFSLADYILYGQPASINQYFSTEVLNLPPTSGLTFSSSLIGYIYILCNSHFFLILFLVSYFIFWLAVYRLLRMICSKDFFLIFASLLSSVAFFTSDSSVEMIYMSVFGLIFLSLLIKFSSRYYRK